MIIKNNIGLKILTPSGYQAFAGLIKRDESMLYDVVTVSDKVLRCTNNHKLLDAKSNIVLLSELAIGDSILTKDGVDTIKEIKPSSREIVYDLLEVDGGNIFYTNDVTSHNCEFLTEELTLIDSALITPAEKRIEELIAAGELIKFTVNDDKFQFYKKLVKDSIYIVGVDPSTGNGNDNGVIQVFEFPSMEHVLEYTTNTLSPQVFYTELKALINFLNEASQEIYFSVENNGVGQGILASYEGDMSPPMAMLISESGKTGVNSNIKTKLRACLQFKDAFERGKVTLNSPQLLTELKSFVRHSGSYAAQIGATDDRIMACMVVFYIIQEISSSNGDAYDMVYTVASDIEERHGWTLNQDVATQTHTSADRSDMLNSFFDSLHGNTGNSGFLQG